MVYNNKHRTKEKFNINNPYQRELNLEISFFALHLKYEVNNCGGFKKLHKMCI